MSEPEQKTFDILHEMEPLAKLVHDQPFLKDGISDTDLVILSTSLIDKFLRLILISGFRSNTVSKTLIAQIFEGDGPLSTFSGRILVCIALGLTNPDVRHDLSIIRKIRNKFAHSPTPIFLSSCEQIKYLRVSARKVIIDPDPIRLTFKQSCVGIIGFMADFTLLATAIDRFVSKNKDGILEEFAALKREATRREHD
jgi:hypothetical protein